ncbi:FHA domain-containing protein [Thalassomonas actiniarum]|uniref:FHA domain-containing protein n=1 Tax=Thalassomonas actiniarum TaxID=485447 RepID=A0AAF0C5C1_9GAMM|nr:FHA domain-containing protein [Thalassomonas actiniarum]WDE00931.1 FHA domain-containing protein [Thalassomonas actiniarum]
MAFILNHNTQSLCYLYGHHSFGRLAYSVNTLVSNAAVSKIHAIIEWENDAWFIRDLSSNGTWLNNRRLPENTKAQLKLSDDIYFAGLKDIRFTVKDLSAPCDLLIPLNLENDPELLKANSRQLPAFSLSHYHLLPSEQNPEIVLYLNRFSGLWSVEYLNQESNEAKADEENALTDREKLSRGQSIHNPQRPHVVNEHDIISFAGQEWRLHLSHLETSTELLSNSEEKINQLSFTFNLTLDEEETQVKMHHQGKTTDFQVRSHHYLTLNLARYRVADAQKGLEPALQGWVYPEQLAKDIGLSISHLNIQIHRARKQFVDALTNISDAEDLIQRQSGKIRFGGSVFTIYKGQHLEATLSHDMAEQTVKKKLADPQAPALRDENNNNMVANFVES